MPPGKGISIIHTVWTRSRVCTPHSFIQKEKRKGIAVHISYFFGLYGRSMDDQFFYCFVKKKMIFRTRILVQIALTFLSKTSSFCDRREYHRRWRETSASLGKLPVSVLCNHESGTIDAKQTQPRWASLLCQVSIHTVFS